MRVECFLTNSAIEHPDKTALVAGSKRLSFADLDSASDRLAKVLVENGFKRGDRAVLFMDNCWEAVVGIFAVLKAGGVFVPLNPSIKADKLAYILNDCRPTALMTQGRLVATADAALVPATSVVLSLIADGAKNASGAGRISFDTALATDHLLQLPEPGIELDLAMLIYTSGSTGFPKGVMMTHHNVVAAATSITTYLEITAADIILNVLPLSFDYGLYQVLMAAKSAATVVLEKSFAFPQAILETMKAERVTGLPLVPTMAAMLLQMRSIRGGDFPFLRYITNTAAALPTAHIERLQELFPQAKLYSMYGLTECKRCTYLPPSELARRPGSVGLAIPGTEAYVVAEDGTRAAPGETGELVIRGPHVMKGYWGNPEATARVLRDGPFPWEKVLHTGDLFRADAEGFLYFVGRKDDIIKSRGEKVSPKEIENVLYQLPGIAEAAVIGVPDPILGHAIKAVVSLAPGSSLSERDIILHCASRLEDFMVPKLVQFSDALPKTDSGKISRRLIVENASEAGG
jgi:amino acid adenylation domain-containing protein